MRVFYQQVIQERRTAFRGPDNREVRQVSCLRPDPDSLLGGPELLPELEQLLFNTLQGHKLLPVAGATFPEPGSFNVTG